MGKKITFLYTPYLPIRVSFECLKLLYFCFGFESFLSLFVLCSCCSCFSVVFCILLFLYFLCVFFMFGYFSSIYFFVINRLFVFLFFFNFYAGFFYLIGTRARDTKIFFNILFFS